MYSESMALSTEILNGEQSDIFVKIFTILTNRWMGYFPNAIRRPHP